MKVSCSLENRNPLKSMSEDQRKSERNDCSGNPLIMLSYVVPPLGYNARGDPVVPRGYEDPFPGCFNQRPLSTAPVGLCPSQIEADLRAMREGVAGMFVR
ncbi:unnamed protein product [Tuber aestivum]|uniref:Uncharacterized protein n=1 Tax=Tuber aestivum TaxID=59557 RepID=A0A292Q1L5_9PEZI|nr:unnamed protein product [Tuber aestivum]